MAHVCATVYSGAAVFVGRDTLRRTHAVQDCHDKRRVTVAQAGDLIASGGPRSGASAHEVQPAAVFATSSAGESVVEDSTAAASARPRPSSASSSSAFLSMPPGPMRRAQPSAAPDVSEPVALRPVKRARSESHPAEELVRPIPKQKSRPRTRRAPEPSANNAEAVYDLWAESAAEVEATSGMAARERLERPTLIYVIIVAGERLFGPAADCSQQASFRTCDDADHLRG